MTQYTLKTKLDAKAFAKVEPSRRVRNLQSALDEWLISNLHTLTSWNEASEIVDALMRSVRFSDSTCDCGSDSMNYPMALSHHGPGWQADYICKDCEKQYSAYWSDD